MMNVIYYVKSTLNLIKKKNINYNDNKINTRNE